MNKKLYVLMAALVHIVFTGSFNLYYEGETRVEENMDNFTVVLLFNLLGLIFFAVFNLKNGGFKSGIGIFHSIILSSFSILIFCAMLFQPYPIYMTYDYPYRIYTFWYYPSFICTIVLAHIQLGYYLRYSQPNIKKD